MKLDDGQGLARRSQVAQAASPQEPYQSEDGSVHYSVCGNGEPVLLIHGLGCSGADWAPQLATLAGYLRLIVPDLPGCGASAPPRDGYSIGGFASALWTVLDELADSCVSIVGFSMGGAVALEMALQRPAGVPRLALINTLASYRDDWHKWGYARLTEAAIRVFGMRRAAKLFASELFPDPWQAGLRDRAAQVVGAVPANRYLSMVDALERWTASDSLDRITGRTLFIVGDRDHTPLGEKREFAMRLRASLVVVHGSRHGTPFDASEATTASLLALLTDQPPPTGDILVCDTPARAQALSRIGDSIGAQTMR